MTFDRGFAGLLSFVALVVASGAWAETKRAGLDETMKRLTGSTFRCEQLSGTGRGDTAEFSFDPANRLRRKTLAGSRGAGKLGGSWTLTGGEASEVRIRVVYDQPGWGTSLTSVELTKDGFEQYEMRDGQRIHFMTCRKL